MSVFTFRRWHAVGLVLTAALSVAGASKAHEPADVASSLDDTTELDFTDLPPADVIEYVKARHDVVVADDVVLINSQRKARKSARHPSIAAQHQRLAEAKIEAALDEKTDLDFTDQPLSDVIEYLKGKHDIEIQLDKKSLTDSGVGGDTPVTRSLKGISLHSALSLILGEIDLDYAVRDEVLLITTKSAMRTMRGLRVYPIDDLVVTCEETDEDLKEDSHPNYQPLITAVRSALGKDAEAEVYAYSLTGSLVVNASFAGQRQVEKLLDLLRQVREQQSPIEDSPK
ncbi:MAG TPA: hypothetical protein VND64_18595 [Pirellulales bacterium]|nr:hypothetical protein [Pirellulales bacterium]